MPVYHKLTVRYTRDQRRQQIIQVLYTHSQARAENVEMTSYRLARSLQMRATWYISELANELVADGHLLYRDAPHRSNVHKRLYRLASPPHFVSNYVQKGLI